MTFTAKKKAERARLREEKAAAEEAAWSFGEASPSWRSVARQEAAGRLGVKESSGAASSSQRPTAVRGDPPPPPPRRPCRGPSLRMNWPQFWTYHVLLGANDLAVITRLWIHAANEEVNRREGPNSASEVQVVSVTTSQQVVLTERGVQVPVVRDVLEVQEVLAPAWRGRGQGEGQKRHGEAGHRGGRRRQKEEEEKNKGGGGLDKLDAALVS